MPLTTGARIGVYQILAELGRGGMGEVYRAKDTRLNRDVAIKVLPDLFASDTDRLARFTREAQVLASLNHPNIAAIYGIEGNALVMELVDGRDLSAIIAGAPISLADALPIARQIIDALEAAHERGIVHRDLKPANIKVRADGTVKVLDFGLAKALDPNTSSAAVEALNSPTMTAAAFATGGTQMGMILGTAAYMAPEQAKGKPVDRRADIWAFGVVLYEMLTGRGLFISETIPETLAHVMTREVDPATLPADTPARVRKLITQCLVKDPKQRLRDIGDARLILDEKDEPLSGASQAAVVPPARVPIWRRALPLAATALVTVAAVAAFTIVRTPPAVAAEVVRFSVALDGTTSGERFFRSQGQGDFAFTGDGHAIVYGSATATGGRFLAIRRLDQLTSTTIPGSERALGPFVSPDDKWVGFLDPSFSYIRKIPISGGVASDVVQSARNIECAAWLGDDTIVYGVSGEGLFVVSGAGGKPERLTKLDSSAGDVSHLWPAAIPGTKAVLFSISAGDPLRTSRLAVLDRATGHITRTDLRGTFPKFLPTGHVVYADTTGALLAVPFDVARLQFTGSPTPIAEHVGVASSGAASFDVSRDGRLAYATAGVQDADRTLVWVDRTGKEFPLATPPRAYYYARVSPDGERLSLDIRDQEQDIWTWDVRGSLARVTRDPVPDQYGLWMPDGQHLITGSVHNGKQVLYLIRADGVGDPELIVEASGAYPNAITPDGKQLIFRSAVSSKGQNDLFIVPIGGDHVVKTLIGTEADELNAAMSPDGHWIAFESNLSGHPEVYVRPFPDVNGGQWPVSTAGGVKPAWAPSGHELLYLSPARKLMSVAITTAGGFSAATPVPLFDASHYFAQGSGRNYDISHDGARFVMVKSPASPDVADAIYVVLNWAGDVAARLPRAAR